MPSVGITVNIKPAQAHLRGIAKQTPFAAATAINDVLFQIQRAETAAIANVFEHPRPFTAKSVQVAKASKGRLIGSVFIRPEVAKYLLPYEAGGVHVLPGKGIALLDPKAVNLDQYGQLPRLLTQRLKARKDVFVGTIQTKSGPVSGFWQRLDVTAKGNVRRARKERGTVYDPQHGALKLLIRFGNALPVNKRLNFVQRADALARAQIAPAFAKAIASALATAK